MILLDLENSGGSPASCCPGVMSDNYPNPCPHGP